MEAKKTRHVKHERGVRIESKDQYMLQKIAMFSEETAAMQIKEEPRMRDFMYVITTSHSRYQ